MDLDDETSSAVVTQPEAADIVSETESESDPDNSCIICLQSIVDRTVLPCAHDEVSTPPQC